MTQIQKFQDKDWVEAATAAVVVMAVMVELVQAVHIFVQAEAAVMAATVEMV